MRMYLKISPLESNIVKQKESSDVYANDKLLSRPTQKTSLERDTFRVIQI